MSIRYFFKKKCHIIVCTLFCIVSIGIFFVAVNRAKNTPNPVVIRNEEDFYKINDNLSGYYVLGDSINFSKPIQPIGTAEKPFTGTLDGLNKFQIRHIVFDFSSIDVNEYVENGDVFLGLIAFNKGTIIHTTFSDVSFVNTDLLSDKNCNLGIICGKNEGKITSNVLYTPTNLNFLGSTNNFSFGAFVGFNGCDLRRNKIVGHLNFRFESSNVLNIGAFAGRAVNGSLFEMLQFGGQISIYNQDDTVINKLSIGAICGNMNGGTILNCDLQKSSIFNMMKQTLVSYCGAVVGLVDSSDANLLISSSVYNGTVRSSGVNVNRISSCIGEILHASFCRIENFLIGGECITYYVESLDEKISDTYNTSSIICDISNSYVLDTYYNKQPADNHISNIIAIDNISLSLLSWDDAFWSISNGQITLKVF